LLAGFAVLLSRYTGRQDIVVGTDVANRNRKETEGLIGFFINQLVLRVDLSGNPTVSQLLSRVREITLGAYDRQDVPFDKVVETVRPARSLQYSPLFQIKLCLQNMPAEKVDLRGLSLSLLKNESTTSQLDFTLNLVDDKQELKGIAEYNTDIFNSGTIQRLLERFKFVLSCVARNKELGLDELTKVIDKGEKQQRIEAELALEASSAQSLRMARRKTVR
jgi:non-ribosomal peptide synthetase component F